MDNQQVPTVPHRELCSVGSQDGRGFGGRMDTCLCTVESLRSSPETITVLLIGYSPIENKFKEKIKVHVDWWFLDFGGRVTELSRT